MAAATAECGDAGAGCGSAAAGSDVVSKAVGSVWHADVRTDELGFVVQLMRVGPRMLFLWLGGDAAPQRMGNIVAVRKSSAHAQTSASGLLGLTSEAEGRFTARLAGAFPEWMFLVSYSLPAELSLAARSAVEAEAVRQVRSLAAAEA
jgi:hypothetical protein